MSLRPEFNRYEGFIFDLDGTIYLGEAALPGAVDIVSELQAAEKRVVFLSNKPLERREAFARKLCNLGIPAEAENVINSSYVMAAFLQRTAPGAVVYCVGEPPLIDELKEAGLRVLSDPSEDYARVDVVVAAFDRTFDYQKLQHAYESIKRGARFVATNPDRTCPIDGTELPDCASMIAAIEACTGRKVETIVGKPNPLMLETALEELAVPAASCIMVGDRLETDIRMGCEAGIDTAAVLTGVIDESGARAWSEANPQWRPTFVLQGVYEMLQHADASGPQPVR